MITVHDSGPGFDLNAVLARNPTTPEALMNCSGRGIFIMREMMDKVDFEIRPTTGTTVRLLKTKRSNGDKPPGGPSV
jgi:anti-sigma regulatory factor (Ser/Thr protein kinase)